MSGIADDSYSVCEQVLPFQREDGVAEATGRELTALSHRRTRHGGVGGIPRMGMGMGMSVGNWAQVWV